MTDTRRALLERLADALAALPTTRPQRVAIDGVDGAGKTTLGDELADLMDGRRPIVRASVDGFHRPRAARYARGRASPEGFYLDSYDYATCPRSCSIRSRPASPSARRCGTTSPTHRCRDAGSGTTPRRS
ncbi:MAG TPA: hypothetical protein VEX15_09025 [Nocardioidaceae bacterium]|nr:hypothetical protein [Nocardioidaceae bacterium]